MNYNLLLHKESQNYKKKIIKLEQQTDATLIIINNC